LKKILAFAAIVEAGTGLLLLLDPAIVVRLLLGAEVSGVAILLGRCFGIALLALAIACWPGRQHVDGGRAAFAGMLVYNALIALFLAWLGAVTRMGGLLLWPAAVLHAVVALALALTWRKDMRAATDNNS
jgi:hypothetical protein